MNIFFKTDSDGNGTEGIGAMAQYQIICYALSKLQNAGYIFDRFRNINHYQHCGIDKIEWDNQINNFFNLPVCEYDTTLPVHDVNSKVFTITDNSILNFKPQPIMLIANKIIDISDKHFLDLRNNINFDVNNYYFDDSCINIGLHIRKYTSTDIENTNFRELFDCSKISYYLTLLKNILGSFREINERYILHIYSQGNVSDFMFIKNEFINENIVYHIDEHPLVSVYHMINSDILICSNSSLSYISHLLNTDGIILARNTFHHKWKDTTILINNQGFFDTNKLHTKLVERYERNN